MEKNVAVKQEKSEKKVVPAFVTIQHVRRVRQWTIPAEQVVKVHRGTVRIKHPRFEKNIVLTPGCVVDVVPDVAKMLIKSKDFQKFGVEGLK